MRFGLIMLVWTTAVAQSGDDARQLLDSISQNVRAADSLSVEGMLVREITTADGETKREELSFRISMSTPRLMRFDALGERPSLQICDGTSYWIYPAGPNSYIRRPATAETCNPPFPHWQDLTLYLVDAKIAGHDHSEFDGQPRECEIVEATYESPKPLMPMVPAAGRLRRSFCIDLSRHLILRERLDRPPDVSSTNAVNYAVEITYSRIESNRELGTGMFRFDPPPGSEEVSAAAASPSPPAILTKHEPKYTREAIKAKLEGTIVISLVVGADGIPRDVKVLHGLGLGLDEEAAKAVATWRFKPATKNGEPVGVQAQVEVNFKLKKR